MLPAPGTQLLRVSVVAKSADTVDPIIEPVQRGGSVRVDIESVKAGAGWLFDVTHTGGHGLVPSVAGNLVRDGRIRQVGLDLSHFVLVDPHQSVHRKVYWRQMELRLSIVVMAILSALAAPALISNGFVDLWILIPAVIGLGTASWSILQSPVPVPKALRGVYVISL